MNVVRWFAVVAGCLLLWIVINYEPLREYFAMRDKLDTYQQTNDQLERDRNELVKEHDALQAGGFPAEKAIREKLLMVKPGEEVYTIEDQTSATQSN